MENFIKPYAQPALGEEDGLTTEDLAKSLKTTKDNIRAVLTQTKFVEMAESEGLNIRKVIRKSGNRGRPTIDTIMDAECARVFAARYGSIDGFKYSLWLVRLEIRLIPKLYQKINILESRLARKLSNKNGTIQIPKYQEDMFGHMILTHFETATKEIATRMEALEAKIVHNQKVVAGLAASTQDALIESGKERREKESSIIKLINKN